MDKYYLPLDLNALLTIKMEKIPNEFTRYTKINSVHNRLAINFVVKNINNQTDKIVGNTCADFFCKLITITTDENYNLKCKV
jgi:hypothetical protein